MADLTALAAHGTYRFTSSSGTVPGHTAGAAGYLQLGTDGAVRVEFDGSIHRFVRPFADLTLRVHPGADGIATVELRARDDATVVLTLEMDASIARVLRDGLAKRVVASKAPSSSSQVIFPEVAGPPVVELRGTNPLNAMGVNYAVMGLGILLYFTITGSLSSSYAQGLGTWIAFVGGLAGLSLTWYGILCLVRANRCWVSVNEAGVEISRPEGVRRVPRAAVQHFRAGLRRPATRWAQGARRSRPMSPALVCSTNAVFPIPFAVRRRSALQPLVDRLNAALGPPLPGFVPEPLSPAAFALAPNVSGWRLFLCQQAWWMAAKRVAMIGPQLLLLASVPLWFVVQGVHGDNMAHPIPGGVTVDGHIVDVFQNPTARSTIDYKIVVGFRTDTGSVKTFTPPVYLTTPPSIGAPVRLSYTPHNPSNAHDLTYGADTWKTLVYAGVGIGGFELVVVLPTSFLVRRSIRRRRDRVVFSDGDPHVSGPGIVSG